MDGGDFYRQPIGARRRWSTTLSGETSYISGIATICWAMHPPGRGSSFIACRPRGVLKKGGCTPRQSLQSLPTDINHLQQPSIIYCNSTLSTQSVSQHLKKPHFIPPLLGSSNPSCCFLKAPPPAVGRPKQLHQMRPNCVLAAVRPPKSPPPLSFSVLFGSPLRELPSG